MNSEQDKPAPRLHVEASSFDDKARHAWVEAEPQETLKRDRNGATVFTPNELHNRFGPGSEPRPDPPLVPTLLVLAATLGIPIIDGERLIEADEGADEGYDAEAFLDPSLLLDDE